MTHLDRTCLRGLAIKQANSVVGRRTPRSACSELCSGGVVLAEKDEGDRAGTRTENQLPEVGLPLPEAERTLNIQQEDQISVFCLFFEPRTFELELHLQFILF